MLVMLLLISMSPEQQALLGVFLSMQPVVRAWEQPTREDRKTTTRATIKGDMILMFNN